VLAFLGNHFDDETESSAQNRIKSLTIGRDIASQVVYRPALRNRFAMANIVLGILAKTGNVPFVLRNPLPYADLVVGIDVARETKKNLRGSINITAIARIYLDNGDFLRYIIHDAPIEGETLPKDVLERLFPLAEFRGKRAVIHRDGYFRGDEKKVLIDWAREIGAEFYLVEILKSGTPGIYGINNGQYVQATKGSALELSDTEAFLVSTPPPFENATPAPLHLRTRAPFTIEQAIHSVLSLTLLHHGSVRPPRLPVCQFITATESPIWH
jgi:argonaute-like protein implicated in RNA metabolism and viral defense